MNWNYTNLYDQVGYDSISNLNKPKTFEQMKEYATILSKDFKFVRVDFYEIDGKVYFGELTFIPAASYLKYKNPKTDFELGDLLKL